MTRYILKKLLILPIVLFFISVTVFSIQLLVPGDPVEILFFGERPSDEVVQRVRTEMGLDKPVHERFISFLKGVLRGDLGTSYQSRLPVSKEIAVAFPKTLQVSVFALVISGVLGITVGVVAAYKKDSFIDFLSMALSLVGMSMPIFWLGLLMINLFGVKLGWLPVFGSGTWKHFVMPALTLGLIYAPVIARVSRGSMLEELRKDYVRTARAKGLPERTVLMGHALKNALIPIVTVMGLRFGNMLGSAFITETVFAWHGVGELGVKAIQARDFPVVQGVILVIASCYVLINAAVDILYGFLNPRIRFD